MTELKTSKHEALIVGCSIADLQIRPIPKDIFERGVYHVQSTALSIGGDAINEATVLARLGHQVTLMGMVGTDRVGDFVLDHCRNEGIDEAFTRVDGINTSINVGLLSEEGVRNCITDVNASMKVFGPEHINFDCFNRGYRVMSFASIFIHPKFGPKDYAAVFRRAHEAGMIVCVDSSPEQVSDCAAIPQMKEALGYVDYFFPNFGEAKWMTGRDTPEECAEVLLSYGIRNVVLKVGKDGAIIRNAQELIRVPAFPDITCIDETGAGDNFAAGFICGLLEDRSLRECGEIATACASIAIENVGASTGVKSRAQVEERLKRRTKTD